MYSSSAALKGRRARVVYHIVSLPPLLQLSIIFRLPTRRQRHGVHLHLYWLYNPFRLVVLAQALRLIAVSVVLLDLPTVRTFSMAFENLLALVSSALQ